MSWSRMLSELAWYKGNDQRADELLRDAIRYSCTVKNRLNEPENHLALGNRALARGEYLEAARLARESLQKYREFNYLIGMDKSLDILQQLPGRRVSWRNRFGLVKNGLNRVQAAMRIPRIIFRERPESALASLWGRR